MARTRSDALTPVDIACMTTGELKGIAKVCLLDIRRLAGSTRSRDRRDLNEARRVLAMTGIKTMDVAYV